MISISNIDPNDTVKQMITSVTWLPLQIHQPRKGWLKILDYLFGIQIISNPSKLAGNFIVTTNDGQLLISQDGILWQLTKEADLIKSKSADPI